MPSCLHRRSYGALAGVLGLSLSVVWGAMVAAAAPLTPTAAGMEGRPIHVWGGRSGRREARDMLRDAAGGRLTPAPFWTPDAQATLAVMRRLVRASLVDPVVIRQARAIVLQEPPRDRGAQARAIRRWLAEHVQFLPDPHGVEALATPREMLDTIAARYVWAGDCDEAAILGAALGLAVGLRARFVALGFWQRGAPLPVRGSLAHVYAEVGPPWVDLDVTRAARQVPPVAQQVIVEV